MGLRIKQLSPWVANQIAAGEVIERPASVVKELLENALDAGADVIALDIGFGGLNLIKVSDNGCGIVAEDLPLAVALHATSKIKELADLTVISSMGFRGEALASIAAVSRLKLSSKPSEQMDAMMLSQHDEGYQLMPCARSQGTTVEVRDLFFNAPVRKKFFRSVTTEYQAIETVVKRFALSALHIDLTLSHNGKLPVVLPAARCEKTKLARVQKIMGKAFIEQATFIDVHHAGMHLTGWVSAETYQRSQNDKQWVYINQRMVKDKLINHAVKKAYEHLLHPGRFPSCLLYLTLPLEEVDVNVHPTKHEVRFQQPRLVHDFITSQIATVLAYERQQQVSKEPQRKMPSNGTALHEPTRNYVFSYPNTPRKQREGEAQWIVLNSEFIVLFMENVPYVVDVKRIQQQRLLHEVALQQLPLAHRPLLVPISYSVDAMQCHRLQRCQDNFNQLGLQFDWVSEQKIVIRAIPILFSQLDMKQVIKTLTATVNTLAGCLQLLVSCQLVDAHLLTVDDVELLIAYLQQQHASLAVVPGCRALNAQVCREMIDG